MTQFSPFDPFCWLIFAAFWACMYLIVKLFHLKYPGYPGLVQLREKPAHEVEVITAEEGEVSVKTP